MFQRKSIMFFLIDGLGPDSPEDIDGGSPTDTDADDGAGDVDAVTGGECSSSDQENILVLDDVNDKDKDDTDVMDVANNENLTPDIPTDTSDEITDTIIQISTSESRQVGWSIF